MTRTQSTPPEAPGREWREIPGFSNYLVSNDGMVYSKPREVLRKDGRNRYPVKGRVLKPFDRGRSLQYASVGNINAGRLVLLAFVGPPPPGCECCHTNGNYRDNRLANVRWGTSKENTADSIRHGTHPRGERDGNSKLTADDVREIRRLYAAGGIGYCRLAARFGIARSNVAFIVRRQTWAHI